MRKGPPKLTVVQSWRGPRPPSMVAPPPAPRRDGEPAGCATAVLLFVMIAWAICLVFAAIGGAIALAHWLGLTA